MASAPTPSAALPCSGLCNSETDLNTVSTVIVPLNTVQCLHCHRGPLSDILAQCLFSSPLKAMADQSNFDKQSFPVQSRKNLFPLSGIVQRETPYSVKWAHTWHNAIQPSYVWFLLRLYQKGEDNKCNYLFKETMYLLKKKKKLHNISLTIEKFNS